MRFCTSFLSFVDFRALSGQMMMPGTRGIQTDHQLFARAFDTDGAYALRAAVS